MPENKDTKLCKLAKKKYLKSNLNKYLELVKNPKFACQKCGRVANNKKLLCKAVELDQ